MLHHHSVNCEPNCAGVDEYITKKILILNTERNVPATYIEHHFISIFRIDGKHSNFSSPPGALELIMARFCTSAFSAFFKASFSATCHVFSWFCRWCASQWLKTLIRTREDFWNQVKGSQPCQAIKKIRSAHRSVRTHFVQLLSWLLYCFLLVPGEVLTLLLNI